VNSGAGFLLIIGGLLLLYVVVTGKFTVLEEAFYKLFSLTPPPANTTPAADAPPKTPYDPTAGNTAAGQVSKAITLQSILIPDYTKTA
jgi:hypothetical protein